MQYWVDFGVENNLLSSQTSLNATTFGATSDNAPSALLKLKYLITAKRTLFATMDKCRNAVLGHVYHLVIRNLRLHEGGIGLVF